MTVTIDFPDRSVGSATRARTRDGDGADDGGLIELFARRRALSDRRRALDELWARPVSTHLFVPVGRSRSTGDAAAGTSDQALVPELPPPAPETFPAKRRGGGPRRLLSALFVAAVLISAGGGAAAQQRYRVQPGDTIDAIAAEFGVDRDAILRSSWLADPPNLAPGEVIVIPDPGQSPSEAAAMAAELEGTSPWTTSAYWVEPGDTIEEIAVAFGVDLGDLIALNELDNPDLLLIGQRILIPDSQTDIDWTSESAPSTGPTLWVPTHRQERSLSCEYASAFIATSAFGAGIPEWVFNERVPPALNPHYGYRGDIDGVWGRYDDYGVYPEPLVPVLNDHGFVGEVFYGEGDSSALIAHLDAGHPVIVWLAMWGDTGIVFDDEGTYTVFAGEHVMVAYAYDDDGVYLSDPGLGDYRFIDWGTFLWMWGTSDGMSLAVYPA